jgi:hypothetical protein
MARPSPFSMSFEAFMRTLIENNPLDKAAVRRWEMFVAGSEPSVEEAARTFSI